MNLLQAGSMLIKVKRAELKQRHKEKKAGDGGGDGGDDKAPQLKKDE